MSAQISLDALPRWASIVVLPLLNLVAAFTVAALVLLAVGESPAACLQIVIDSALLSGNGLQFTLFYATGFIFTGLAVSLAIHAGLFNIGGEGQVYLAGLGITLASFMAASWPAWLALPFIILMAMLFGAAWAFLPAYFQAVRGSHIVVTTIMFNFIANSVMNYLLTNHLMQPGSQNVSTVDFSANTWMPDFSQIMGWFGKEVAPSPLNASLLLALLCAVLFYWLVWRTRFGYELRTLGSNPDAAIYAGISVPKMVILVVCASGALAGLAAVNDISGSAHRMSLGFPNGVGFIGIAVALMGRNHPVGICLSALLFGVLIQGGLELSLSNSNITNHLVFLIQGLIILFCGALTYLFVPLLARFNLLGSPKNHG
jgi:general nucleoside transport system permease protein